MKNAHFVCLVFAFCLFAIASSTKVAPYAVHIIAAGLAFATLSFLIS